MHAKKDEDRRHYECCTCTTILGSLFYNSRSLSMLARLPWLFHAPQSGSDFRYQEILCNPDTWNNLDPSPPAVFWHDFFPLL